jgi:AcrR family transcriptional regulator
VAGDKPLRADAVRNRARVLAAAQEAFAAEGLAVPLDDIARRAGVGAGTVYRHFPTKEALFEAVILDRITRFVDHARKLATAEDPGAAFIEFLHHLVAGAASSRDLVDALAGSNLDTAGLIIAAKADLSRAGGELLVSAQRAGAVRADIGMTEVMALFAGTTLALQQQPADDALRERVFAVIRDGLLLADRAAPTTR